MVRLLIAAVVLAAVAIGACGGGDGDDGQRTAPPRAVFTGAGVTGGGRLVDIGGRSLYIECGGTGTPTVVLEAGFGGSSGTWATVFPALSRTTRTCAYDRAGLGSSVGIRGVHDAGDEVADLERLVDRAGLPGPYVLVGHSYGGLLVRMFARRQPSRTAGIVLVDSMGRDQTKRELALWPRSVAPAARRAVARRVVDGVDLRTGEALAGGILTLDDTPLVVITAGLPSVDPSLPPRLRRTQADLWRVMQDELAALSRDSAHVVALHSDHFVQRVGGQPRVVVRAVQAVVRAVRDGTDLPSCPELFTGPGVRCRG